jgi:hypothetical protein
MVGLGVPYDVVEWDPAAPKNLTTILYGPNGSARYGAFIM